MSNSLQPHGLQHARIPCPSLSPRVFSNSCPLSRWCHPTISSSVIPFFSHLQSFPASGSFPMSQLFTSGGQSIGASFSISPSNEYSGLICFRIYWFDLLAVQGTLKSLPQHHSSKASILQCSAFLMVQLSHPCMTTGKTIALTRRTFVDNMYIIICEIDRQSRFDAWDRVLRAGALGWPIGMGWGRRWEGGSGWGTHVQPWLMLVNVWQKPPPYCKVIILQLNKLIFKKLNRNK